MRVLDASMALAWLFLRVDPAEAALADRALGELDNERFLVPPIWYAEVSNALLLGERSRVVTQAQCDIFLAELAGAEIESDSVALKLRQGVVRALARTHLLTAYDATYLELAIRAGATLYTFDGKLAEAARNAQVPVFGDAP